MAYKFQFVGEPFSRSNPGATVEVNEDNVEEMRRNGHLWAEVDEVGSRMIGKSSHLFQYIGPPFSKNDPGAIVTVPGYDLEARRKSKEWLELPADYLLKREQAAAEEKEYVPESDADPIEMRTWLAERGIEYDKRWGKSKLYMVIMQHVYDRFNGSKQRTETAA